MLRSPLSPGLIRTGGTWGRLLIPTCVPVNELGAQPGLDHGRLQRREGGTPYDQLRVLLARDRDYGLRTFDRPQLQKPGRKAPARSRMLIRL